MNSTQRKNKKVKRREGKGREIFYRKYTSSLNIK